MKHPVVSFNAGELSPLIDARSDVDKYEAGCRTLENMIPRIYGPAERRPGTKYIETCNGVARVIPFIYSNTIAYIVLLEDHAMYFYYNGGQVLDASGRRLKVDTPYSAADLFEIQYKQSNDVMWLVHPDYAPRKLKRTSATSFVLEEIVFNNGPFMKRNDLAFDNGITLTPSTTGSVTTDDVTDETGATYTASSSYNSTSGAAKAFDDNLTPPGSYWQSQVFSGTANQWVCCQFVATKVITQIRIAPHVAAPTIYFLDPWDYNPKYIRIEASNDGVTWLKIPINGWYGNTSPYNGDEAVIGHVTSPSEFVHYKLNNAVAYQYWRVYIVDNWDPLKILTVVRINEIEMLTSTASWGSTTTLTASEPMFDIGHIGALFSLTQQRAVTEISGSLTAPNTGVIGDPILTEGSFTFTTHGTWTGTVSLQRSIDGTIWETYRTWTSDADTNVQYTGEEEEANVYYRINVTSLTANTAAGTTGIVSKIKVNFTVNSSTQTGICRVTGYTSSTVVTVQVLVPFASTDATARWAEGSWSTYRGFPCTMTFFENRAVYAGTPHQPQTVWFSGVDDFEDFAECNKDDSAFSLTMSSDTRCAIQWISALESLIVGTSGGEWRIRSTSFDEPLTPNNFSFKQQTTYGSKSLQALPVNDVILFADFVGRKVREATYNGDKDKYVAPDLSALAEHITKTGIVGMAYQKNPDPILWSFRTDGTLLSMTYEREQNVIGWARHPFYVGGGATGDITIDVPSTRSPYPTLQELTAAEIPATPTLPTDTALAGAVSVTDATGLQAMTPGNHYSIDADIDLAGVTWTPLNFNSTSAIVIEGNGHKISNLTINAPTSNYQGFIGIIDGTGGGQIRNLEFVNCSVTGQNYVGVFCGAFQSDAANFHLKNISLTSCAAAHNNAAANLDYLGLLCGWFSGDGAYVSGCAMTNCTLTATANRSQYVGALAGAVREQTAATTSYFVNCTVSGGTMTISATTATACGGFVGYQKCVVASTIRNHEYYNCTSSMAVSYSKPTGTSTVSGFGGFFGYVENAQAVTCAATGNISITGPSISADGIGGFIGTSCCYETYTNCHCSGSVTFTDTGGTPDIESVGGFIGFADLNIQILRCYTQTAITFETAVDEVKYVGGFVGKADCFGVSSTISRSWAEGDITFEKAIASGFHETGIGYGFIGGFIGWLHDLGDVYMGDIINCYTWSSIVMSGSYPTNLTIAGFVGGWDLDAADLTFTNCYCAQTDSKWGSGYTAQIPADGDSHGFGATGAGITAVGLTAIYYDTQTSSLSTSGIGTAQTTAWLQTQANFETAGWDFGSIWVMTLETTTTEQSYPSSGLGVNSVAVIPAAAEDEVWIVVARVINQEVVRFLEQMQPRAVDDQEDMWFVDAALDYDGAAVSSFSGLDHLEGEEVAILANGAVMTRQTVTSGAITLPEATTRAIVGLPFRYILKPMRFDLRVDGGTKGTLKRFAELVISFYRSGNVWYGTDTSHLFRIDFRTEEAYGSPPALYTGDKVMTCEGGFNVEDPIIITGNDPLPCVVRAMVPRIAVTGR